MSTPKKSRKQNDKSKATALPCPPTPEELRARRRRTFANDESFRMAEGAEIMTGLDAREVFRPATESTTQAEIEPEDKRMRCQLGRRTVIVLEPNDAAAEGSAETEPETVEYFQLKAHGRTWAEAVNHFWRLQQ